MFAFLFNCVFVMLSFWNTHTKYLNRFNYHISIIHKDHASPREVVASISKSLNTLYNYKMEMTNDNEKREMIKDKVKFFLDEKIKVHITKTDRSYINGFILSEYKPNVYVFNETKFGEIYLFLSDIYDIDKYRIVEG